MTVYPLQAILPERRRAAGRISNAFGASAVLTMPACIVIAAGIVLPLAYMLVLSVQTPDPGEVVLTTNFTAANYLKFFTSPFYWNVLVKTIWVASATTALCAFLGLTLAVSMWLTSPRWRGLCVIAVISPLLVSIVTRAFGWMVVLGDYGLINSLLIHLGIITTPLRMEFTRSRRSDHRHQDLVAIGDPGPCKRDHHGFQPLDVVVHPAGSDGGSRFRHDYHAHLSAIRRYV
jgi:ABC-type spermidine/putrescine transport system permease subunit I